MWAARVTESATAPATTPRPVRRPRANSPRATSERASERLNAYSPASVENRFPPEIVNDDSKRNGSVEAARQAGSGCAEAEQPAHRVGAHRQQQRAEDRRQLEGDRVGHHEGAEGGEQVREDEVIGVEGEPVEPPWVPPRELAVGQQLGAKEPRQGHVGTGVASRGERVGDEQRRVQRPQRDREHAPDRDEAADGVATRGAQEHGAADVVTGSPRRRRRRAG